jgi:hypothetical protein
VVTIARASDSRRIGNRSRSSPLADSRWVGNATGASPRRAIRTGDDVVSTRPSIRPTNQPRIMQIRCSWGTGTNWSSRRARRIDQNF